MSVAEWISDAIFYQIFPDRFANGDPGNDPANVQPWGAPPTRHGFQGGDLRGITQKMDYLLDLGINALYLNPIFLSPSNHRYDTVDYLRIDPKLGDLEDFHALIETAHRNNIRVILDGVFNHCGRGFFAFSDILENEAESPYTGWYHIHRYPLRAYEPGKARNYSAWWGFKSLPKFNTNNPAVRRYLLNVSRYWIEQGADGWRLDVPNEIDDDSFWAEFREVVYQANPQAYTLGEIWEVWPRWANDTHFDGLMNYPVQRALMAYVNGQITTSEFAGKVESLLTTYPRENVYAMYNLLGSHDVERILTQFGYNADKVRLAMLFQFAYPGAPAIYYGDEVGVTGGRDPDCRRAFPWDESQWNTGLRAWAQKLITVRKSSQALRRGEYTPLVSEEGSTAYAFARTTAEECVVIALNPTGSPVEIDIPVHSLGIADGSLLKDVLGNEETPVKNGRVHLHLNQVSGVYLAEDGGA
jgi:cyclomaltodextrinase / maltogenic alpha-amylase / neopullulanase